MKAAVIVGESKLCQSRDRWVRGRPARNAPKMRRFWTKSFSRFALIAGGAPAVPANHLRAFGLIAVVLICANVSLAQRGTNKVPLPPSSSLVITTEPNAIIWIDEIRLGITNPAGR